eukprot:PITA_04698
MTREARNQRNVTGIKRSSYNNVSPLENEIECLICNNFGHEESECINKFQQTPQKKQTPLNPKIWTKKESQTEICCIALYAKGQENQWYIDRGCSKHITGDKEKLHSYNALEKKKNVSFGNDNPAVINGKGSVFLKEKVKARNVMYVDGLKHNMLSVSQMCDQGNEVVFRSNGCVVRELDIGKTVIKDISIPENTICKPCQIGLLKHKDEAFENFQAFKALVETESDRKIKCLRSDRGGEFILDELFDFCEQHGIEREFSTTRTPQQNGVVERMNKTVQESARAMLDESGTPATFWGEAAFVVVTIFNKANVRVNSTQTPHEIWYGKTPTIKYFKFFGSKCFIKSTNEKLGRFEPRANERILLGYSSRSKGYKCYNKRLGKIFESIDVVVDEACRNPKQIKSIEYYDNQEYGDYFPISNENYIEEETNEALEEDIMVEEKTPSWYVQKNHPETQILG